MNNLKTILEATNTNIKTIDGSKTNDALKNEGWSGPYAQSQVQGVDRTKYDVGKRTTSNGEITFWTKSVGGGGGGSNSGGGGTQTDTRACPPDVKKFQQWLNDKNKPWYSPMPGPVNGNCGTKTKDAWATYKSEFESGTGGGGTPSPAPVTPQPAQPSKTIEDIDKDVASAATFFRFYTRNTNDEQIFWLNPVQNTSFETDSRIMSIVSRASRIKKMEGVNAAFAYLKAVIFETGDLVGSFDILAGKVGELNNYKTTRLDENTTFHKLIGLANLLLEDTSKYVRYFIKRSADGGKYIGGERGSNKRGNLDVTWVISQYFNNDTTYFSPLKFSSSNGLPDESPIVGEVKSKFGLQDRSNVFTQELETKIKEHRKQNNIPYSDAEGDIDFALIRALFKDRFDETQKRIESSRSDQ